MNIGIFRKLANSREWKNEKEKEGGTDKKQESELP
jgi:hypothetical protein